MIYDIKSLLIRGLEKFYLSFENCGEFFSQQFISHII